MALAENFEQIVRDMANQKKIKLSSFGWGRIRTIGKGIKRGETKTADVIGELQQEKEFRLALDGGDWREMERKIERMLH